MNKILENFDCNLKKYKKDLENHDWYYFQSDDMRVWREGQLNHDNLIEFAINNGKEYMVAFNQIHEKHFGGGKDYKPPFLI